MEDLEKSGLGVTDVGYYKEALFRKVDTKGDAAVRSMAFDGVRFGKVIVVGVDEFVIKESDGEHLTIQFSDILDLQ